MTAAEEMSRAFEWLRMLVAAFRLVFLELEGRRISAGPDWPCKNKKNLSNRRSCRDSHKKGQSIFFKAHPMKLDLDNHSGP